MRLHRALIRLTSDDDISIRGVMIECKIPGIEQLFIAEGTWDLALLILDGILLDDTEKGKWLEKNINSEYWAKITGDIRMMMGPPDGFYERDTGSDNGGIHRVELTHILTPIVVEVLSDFQLKRTTQKDSNEPEDASS